MHKQDYKTSYMVVIMLLIFLLTCAGCQDSHVTCKNQKGEVVFDGIGDTFVNHGTVTVLSKDQPKVRIANANCTIVDIKDSSD